MTDTSFGSEADLEVPQKPFIFTSQQAHHNLLVNECVAAEAYPSIKCSAMNIKQSRCSLR